MPLQVDRGGLAPSVLELLPFGQSRIASRGGADGEGVSPSPVSIHKQTCNPHTPKFLK